MQPLDLYGPARVLSDSRKNDERGNTGGGEKASERGRERERESERREELPSKNYPRHR